MGELIDLTGQKFGKLTVIKRISRTGAVTWECQCDCGKITYVLGANLRYGHTKSCGCLKGNRFVGQRIDKLIIMQQINATDYLCLCDCGQNVIRTYKSLITQKSIQMCDVYAKK